MEIAVVSIAWNESDGRIIMSKAMPAPDNRPKLRIRFRDDQINKYLPDGVEDMKIGDTVSLTLRARVIGLEKSEEYDYEVKPDEKPQLKLHREVEIELVSESKADKQWNDQKRRLGKNAISAMRQVGMK